MPLTDDDRVWHHRYQQLPQCVRNDVDMAYDQCVGTLSDAGVAAPNDDRAEALVAAITRYVVTAHPVEKVTIES